VPLLTGPKLPSRLFALSICVSIAHIWSGTPSLLSNSFWFYRFYAKMMRGRLSGGCVAEAFSSLGKRPLPQLSADSALALSYGLQAKPSDRAPSALFFAIVPLVLISAAEPFSAPSISSASYALSFPAYFRYHLVIPPRVKGAFAVLVGFPAYRMSPSSSQSRLHSSRPSLPTTLADASLAPSSPFPHS